MNIDQWFYQLNLAYEEKEIQIPPGKEAFLLSEFPETTTYAQKQMIEEFLDVMTQFFYNKASHGEIFGDLSRIKERFGNSIEENYGISSGPFVDFAKTYWTYKLEVEDLYPNSHTLVLSKILKQIEMDIASVFFPTPGPVEIPVSQRKKTQRKLLQEFASDIDIERFLSESPILGAKSGRVSHEMPLLSKELQSHYISNAEIEIRTSTKRLIGAVFFGLILSGYIDNAFRFTIPRIISIAQKIELDLALIKYESSILLNLFIGTAIGFFVAAVSAFLARRKGIIVGILSNSIYILLIGAGLILAVVASVDELIGNISLQLFAFIKLFLLLLASIFGGIIGEKYYSPNVDLDLDKDKVTIFGVRWFNYLWILPFIIYPYLTSLIILIYSGILIFIADFYFMFHPSVWFKFTWWFYFAFAPLLVIFAAGAMFGGFPRFWEIMQHKQTESRGWKKFGQILLFGIGAPVLAWALAYFGANITHNIPKGKPGEAKIVLIIIGIIVSVGVIISFFSWIKEKLFAQNKA